MNFVDVEAAERVADTTILLVEDDHGDAVLVQACLREVGVAEEAVCWTRSLAEAFAMLGAMSPGCILLDLGLPDALGFEAVRDMVEAVPTIPVIVLTGRREQDGADALTVGAQDYLVKDALTGELLERSMRYAKERKRAQIAQQQLRDFQLGAAEQARLERGLLPRPLLRTDRIGCATYYRPGRDDAVLGGDFFDIVETTDGRIRAVIGDVMGHGPDEAALGVHLRVAWRTLLLADVPDDEILPNLAKLLDSEDSEHPRYVTVCDVTIEDTSLTVRVAGHPAPIVSSQGSARYPQVQIGPPLGVNVRGNSGWPASQFDLPRGSSVLLYTDGLLECYQDDRRSESLGIDELVEAVGRCTRDGAPATSWITTLVGGAPHTSVDDTAAIVLTSGEAP